MAKTETEADMPSLLGVLAVIGISADAAPELLQRALDAPREASARKEAFRAVVRIGMKTTAGDTGAARFDMPYMTAFETLATDARLGLFLLSMLEFDLQDTAYILDTEPRVLATRLDRALDGLDAPLPHRQR